MTKHSVKFKRCVNVQAISSYQQDKLYDGRMSAYCELNKPTLTINL